MHYGYLHMVSRELVRELTRPQAEAPRNPYYETHRDTIFVRAGASDICPSVSFTALINVEGSGILPKSVNKAREQFICIHSKYYTIISIG